MYQYDEEFYQYINRGAFNSANRVLPALIAVLPDPVQSVLDVGCGAGAWLNVWKTHGAEVVGLDGDYVNGEQLMVDREEFVVADLSKGFNLDRRFTIVQSLEVAEHLPEITAKKFVESLCHHSDMILFSAAPPGQGGENHINEQPYEYWRELFLERGYDMYDPVRPAVLSDSDVKPWYRYNTFLYVAENCKPKLRDALSVYRVAGGEPVRDLSPRMYQLRKRLICMLPSGMSTYLATLKKSLFLLAAKFKDGYG